MVLLGRVRWLYQLLESSNFVLGSVHLNASVYTTGLICPRDVNHGELIVRTISVLVFRLSQRMTNRLAD